MWQGKQLANVQRGIKQNAKAFYFIQKMEDEKMKKFFEKIFTIAIIAFFAWLIISFVDVNANNLNPGNIAWWNFFNIL